MTAKRIFFLCEQTTYDLCMCSIKIFTFFSDLTAGSKIVLAVTNVVVFIALCTVLLLYIKGYTQFNLISRNMLTIKGCSVLVEIYFA